LVFSGGPGGFRQIQEAGRNHFHLTTILEPEIFDLVIVLAWAKIGTCKVCPEKGTSGRVLEADFEGQEVEAPIGGMVALVMRLQRERL